MLKLMKARELAKYKEAELLMDIKELNDNEIFVVEFRPITIKKFTEETFDEIIEDRF